MMSLRSAVLYALVLLLPASTAAQHFPSDAELTSLIQSRVDAGVVGIVLGVMEADGSTRVVTAGDAGPGARPLGELTVFEIGSITKAFTGILLAEMAQRGEVKLADPVSRYLPAEVGFPSRAGRDIALVDLATHRSALPRLPNNLSPADALNPYADYSVEQLYEFLSAYALPRDVGSEYEYSNLATGLLGHVLSRAAGSSYEVVLREHILTPLRMEMTGIRLTDAMREWMAKGHNRQGNVVPLWDLPTLAGAGALRSNMRDMLRFLAANVGEPETDLERAMRTAHEPRAAASDVMSVGLNWHIRSVGDASIVWHNGGTGGFRTFVGFDPERDLGAVVLTNSTHGADDIGFHLINGGIPLSPPQPPRERVALQLSEDVLDDYVGEYQITSEFAIAVTLVEGALFVQATGQPTFPIFAESDNEFFLRAVDAQITFVRGEAGAVTGLILHQGGQDAPGRKVR